MLMTTLNNIGSKTLFMAVFIRPEQVVRFWLCRRICASRFAGDGKLALALRAARGGTSLDRIIRPRMCASKALPDFSEIFLSISTNILSFQVQRNADSAQIVIHLEWKALCKNWHRFTWG